MDERVEKQFAMGQPNISCSQMETLGSQWTGEKLGAMHEEQRRYAERLERMEILRLAATIDGDVIKTAERMITFLNGSDK